jgi:hypothetical protein
MQYRYFSVHLPIFSSPLCAISKATTKLIANPLVLVRNGAMIAVFLILMLKKLDQLAKLLRAQSAVVRELRNPTITISTVTQHWHHDVLIYLSHLLSKLIDLCASIVGTATSSAGDTLDMLCHMIGTRFEASITADRTGRNVARSMN